MIYSELAPEIREQIEANKMTAIRYSASAADPANTITDAMLINKSTPMNVDELDGYSVGGAFEAWFEHNATGKSDNEAERYALNCIMDVNAEFAEPRIKELEAANEAAPEEAAAAAEGGEEAAA